LSDVVVWFGEEEGAFKVAIGVDGAPFGKWDQSMSWLLSFLNVGPRVASPNDNFLLFGANCKEDHKVVSLFTEILVSEIEVVENRTDTCVNTVHYDWLDLVEDMWKFRQKFGRLFKI